MKSITVLSHNIFYPNKSYDRILQLIRAKQPDMVFLQEAHNEFVTYAANQMSAYPFQYYKAHQYSPAFNILYSRYPIEASESLDFPNASQGALFAKISVDGTKLDFLGTHTQSPKTVERIFARQKHIKAITSYITSRKNKEIPLILAGDFNSVPWHEDMRAMFEQTTLQNQILGLPFGTWPAWMRFSLFTIPIDHIFGTPDFQKITYESLPQTGSDHFPVYSEFYFCE